MNLFELRILNPATGKVDIVLPDVETFAIAPMLSDVGTVQFTYPKNGLNYAQILNDRDLYIYYQGVEVQSLRATLEQSQGDDASLAEEGDMKTFNARMAFSHLDRAIVYPSGWPTTSNPATQDYSGVTIGQVLIDLLQKAQSRGSLTNFTWSFTATHDSNGVAWDNVTISFNAQTTYLTCLQTMVSYALCDLQMVGYRLDAYVYQTQGVDHTTVEPPLIMRRGRDLTQAQNQNSTMGLSTVALVAGGNNTYVEVTNSVGLSTRGRREIGYSQSGVTDEGTLGAVGTALLQTVADEVKARTLQLNFGDPNCPFPIDDFNVGDWVFTDVNDGALTRQRVIQWTVMLANDGTLTGTVALDNIFQEKMNRLNGRLNALQNGVVIQGKSDPTPVQTIKFPPKVPTGLAIGSLPYQDNQGHTFAQATITWDPVTEDSSGAAESNLANYAVRHRLSPSGVWSQNLLVNSGTTTAYVSPFLPNRDYDFEVSAIDTQDNSSGWSAVVTQTMSADTTAPNSPSTPTVASTLGQLTVVWDGLDHTAAAMPTDFDHVSVYASASGSGFTPSAANLYGTMRQGGTFQIPGSQLIYNTEYWVKLVAVDRTGNASVPSAAGTATLAQVVYTDIGSGQVGLNNIAFSDVGNLIDNGSFEDPTWQAIRNAEFGGTHWSIDSTTASSGTTSIKHAGATTDDLVVLNTVNCKPGQVFMGAADIKMDSAVTSTTMVVALGVTFRDASGVSLGYSELVQNWSSPSTNDNTWRARITESPATAPSGTVKADFVLKTTSHTAGNVWFDNVEVRAQIDTLLIKDAAITDAKVNDLSANKITAGTVNAGIVLSGTIETATTGGRVLIDGGSDTIYIYDSSGVNIGTFGVGGLQLFVNPGTGKMVINHAPGSTFSPVIQLTANSTSPPVTPAQIYTNYLTAGSNVYEDLVLKSPIESDGTYARMALQSGYSGGPSALGAGIYYDAVNAHENIALLWNSAGLQGGQLGLGTSFLNGDIPISTGLWMSKMKFIDGVFVSGMSFTSGVGTLVVSGALYNILGGVFNCGNGGATQVQMISSVLSGGTVTVTVHAFGATGAAFTGTCDFWGLVWG
jgi:hypothetical protein